MQLTLGEMLYRFRMERNVESRLVCHGLCSPATISNMENGERVPDTLMFECFMERMGIAPTQFSIMVTEDESKYLEWKNLVWDAIESENWDELGKLLKSKILKKTYCNKKLENQFVLYANGIYEAKNGNYKEAAEYLEQAAEQTIPEPEGVIEERALLGELEISILMLYLYYGVKGKVISQPQAKHLFDILEKYIYSDALDIENQARCYPKLVCIGMHVLEHLTEEEKKEYLEKAIELSRKDKTFHDLTEVLRLYIPILEKSGSSEVGYYKKHYEVFCDLLETEGFSIYFKPEIVKYRQPQYYILQEYLVSKRKELGLTQSELSEGICEPETYSRVESGKRAPSRKNMEQLSERLGISWNYYRGELNTTNPRAFELRRAHRLASIEGRHENSLRIIQELEKQLDMNIIENYQYVRSNEYVIKYKLRLIDGRTVYDELKNLLSLTQNLEMETLQLVYYTQTELEILGNMARLLESSGNYQEGLQIVLGVLKQIQYSKLGLEYQWGGIDFLLRNLAGLYFCVEKYDVAIKIAQYVKQIRIKQRKADSLPHVLDEIGDCLEHIGMQYRNEYEKLYRYTYYVSDFFEIGIKENAKKIYEERFDERYNWYNI